MFTKKGKFRFSILCLTLVIGLNTYVTGQNSVKGLVLNMENQMPVPDATVYINGTTNGISTDANGLFELKDVVFPCQLMIRQVGYELKMINLENPIDIQPTIFLKLKSVQLSEVKITALDLRAKNVERFKNSFLGKDEWGRKAKLLNDSVLVFNSFNDTAKIQFDTIRLNYIKKTLVKSPDSTNHYQISTNLSVDAKAPLLVDLPLLGYKLSVDLVSFNLQENKKTSLVTSLGFYYFKPYDFVNKRVEKILKANRLEAYYESIDHFCRMLYSDELKQNGYLLIQFNTGDTLDFFGRQFVNLKDLITYKDENEVIIIGQKGKSFGIYDFYNHYTHKPIDLTNIKRFDYSSVTAFWQDNYEYTKTITSLKFLSDTCIVRSDGTIPDNSIMFTGWLATKNVGAKIPTNYQPGD